MQNADQKQSSHMLFPSCPSCLNKGIPICEYKTRAEMSRRHRVQPECEMQARSNLLKYYPYLVPYVYKEAAGFLGKTAAISS